MRRSRLIRLNDCQRDRVGFVGLRSSVGFFFMRAGIGSLVLTKDQASDDELGVNFNFTFHFAADPVDMKSGGTQ